MAAPQLKKTQGNSASTTLSSGVASGDTSAPLTADTNFAGEGMVVISEGEAVEEFAYATAKAGGALTIPLANRGEEGGSAQTHASGATVKGILTAGMWNDLIDQILVEHADAGTHDATKVVSLDGSGNMDSTITGWIASADTWTYASATTFTIAGVDRTATFTKGTKIKLTQTTAKYFYVASSSFSTDTTVTVTGGTDYTLANAAITAPFYSYTDNPQGFPTWFAYTATPTAGGGTPPQYSASNAVFALHGRMCTVQVGYGGDGGNEGAGTNQLYIPLPILANTSFLAGELVTGGAGFYVNGGTSSALTTELKDTTYFIFRHPSSAIFQNVDQNNATRILKGFITYAI